MCAWQEALIGYLAAMALGEGLLAGRGLALSTIQERLSGVCCYYDRAYFRVRNPTREAAVIDVMNKIERALAKQTVVEQTVVEQTVTEHGVVIHRNPTESSADATCVHVYRCECEFL